MYQNFKFGTALYFNRNSQIEKMLKAFKVISGL
jgi:hypothetical protein